MLCFGKKAKSAIILAVFNWSFSNLSSFSRPNNEKPIVGGEARHWEQGLGHV